MSNFTDPLKELNIARHKDGFYEGFNKVLTITSKVLISLFVIWAAVYSEEAGKILSDIQKWSFQNFGAWYIYTVTLFIFICLALAIYPKSGKVKLGKADEKPEFSNFSWFSMMFGAGIGIGMLTFSTAEPLFHYASNPDTIRGLTEGKTEGNLASVFKWSFLHWGLGAWAVYAIVGLSLSYFSYNRGLPLTIRSALTPLFGKRLEGTLGHIVDITGVIATILGLSVTLGFGIAQFAAGMFTISEIDSMINADGSPTTATMIIALVIVMLGSVFSALSGVGKGIKWLSNINMTLSIGLLLFFLILGSTLNSIQYLFIGIWEYVINLPVLLLEYWGPSEVEPAATLYKWQSIWWSVFYWAWWIAFAPFVGVFLARISKGRTLREFVLGAILVPSLMCFTWFSVVGGTAIDLELFGNANGSILAAGSESQLFATFKVMLGSTGTKIMSGLVVILLFTYLVTSADSGILIINTINSGGETSKKNKLHIVVWGIGLFSLIVVLLIAGGMSAIKSAMLVGALPFSLIMVLMAISLTLAILRDIKRNSDS